MLFHCRIFYNIWSSYWQKDLNKQKRPMLAHILTLLHKLYCSLAKLMLSFVARCWALHLLSEHCHWYCLQCLCNCQQHLFPYLWTNIVGSWFDMAWNSFVRGDEGSYLPNCQANLDIALHALPIILPFHKHYSLPLVRYNHLSPIGCCASRVGRSIQIPTSVTRR